MASNEEKAEAVQDFVNSMIGALESGFTETNTLSLDQLYRVMQNHCEDEYGVNVPPIIEAWGLDAARHCGWPRGENADGGKPLTGVDSDVNITTEMKAENMCGHSFTVTEPCPRCALHLNNHFDDIECLCDDEEARTYEKEIIVPWTTCKEIYASMRQSEKAASLEMPGTLTGGEEASLLNTDDLEDAFSTK